MTKTMGTKNEGLWGNHRQPLPNYLSLHQASPIITPATATRDYPVLTAFVLSGAHMKRAGKFLMKRVTACSMALSAM